MPDTLIFGATSSTYVPVAGDVGRQLYCRVKGTNVAGFAFASALPTGAIAPAAVAPVPPSILSAPNIADLTPEVGEILHTTNGTWAGVPAPTFSYQWHRVTGAAPEAPSNLTAPAIADLTPQVGETLHTTDGTWDGAPAPVLSYQWHRVTVDAPEAPSNTGAPNIADTTPQVGETLHVTDGTWDGYPAPTFSYEWHRVTAVVPMPPSGGVPSIADVTPEVDEVLHVDHGAWAGDVPITYGYEWFQVGTASTITSSATVTNVENTVLAHALTASEAVTWAIVGGADWTWFELSGSTLRWTGNGTKNFEIPTDDDLNNAYVVTIEARTATSQVTSQTITVTVTNVVDATLAFDFTADTSVIAGVAANSTAALTVSRAGTAFYAERLDGVWTSFGVNVARRTDRGLLIEEARTNVCLQNRTQTNASWVKTNCTATKNQIGIDGVTNSACSLTATAANATCLLTTTIASSARWQTAFVKRLSGTGDIQMTQNNGTTWTTVTTTGSWTRVTCPTVTAANPVVGFRIVTSGDSVAVDFVQNENSGTFATSPIPTTTATVTRAADVITLNTTTAPLANWFNQPAGTLYAEGIPYAATLATSTAFQIDSGAATNLHYVGLPGGTAAAGGTTTASTVVGTFNGTFPGGTSKSAWAYALNDMAGSYNSGAVVADATGTMPTGLTTVRLGKLVAATMWSGYLRKITYMNGRLSNAELVTLTTL